MLEGVGGQLGIGAQFQLAEYSGPVGLNRFDAEVELAGDLGVSLARREHPEDLDLPVGQRVLRPPLRAANGMFREGVRELPAHVPLPAQDRPDCSHHFAR